MKPIIAVIVCFVLLIPFVTAHAIEKGPISKSTEEYTIQFSAEPKFPVTGRETHLDFIIHDKSENLASNLDVNIELHKEEATITLNVQEEERGHYGVAYEFQKAGKYEIHIIVDDNELEAEFNFDVDNFGLSGILRSLVILFLLEILIIKVIFD